MTEDTKSQMDQSQSDPELNEELIPSNESDQDAADVSAAHDDSGLLRLVDQLFRHAEILKAPPEFAERVIAVINEQKEKSPLLRWLKKRFNLP